MRSFTLAERRARLARRHFLTSPADSVTGATASFVGLHATDPSTPYLSLWARLPGFTVDDLDSELYRHRGLLKQLEPAIEVPCLDRQRQMHTHGLPVIDAAR